MEESCLPEEYLVDYDWATKRILGSSSITTLDEPLAEMTFHVATPNIIQGNRELNSIQVELTMNDLKNMITALEKAIPGTK